MFDFLRGEFIVDNFDELYKVDIIVVIIVFISLYIFKFIISFDILILGISLKFFFRVSLRVVVND